MSDSNNIFDNINVNRDAINKDDILKLFTEALKTGDPFVSEFNRRVVVPIAQKIESRIKVTPITVKGDEFGEYLTESLQSASEKSIKSAGKKIGKQVDKFASEFQIPTLNPSELKIGMTGPLRLLRKLFTSVSENQKTEEDLREHFIQSIKKQIDKAVAAAQKHVNKGAEQMADRMMGNQEAPAGIPAMSFAIPSPANNQFKSLSEEGNVFTIGDYTETALDKLAGLFENIGLHKAVSEKKDGEGEGFLKSLFNKFPFLPMLLGGLAGLYGLFTSGPLKGLSKILTKFALGGVLKTIGKALIGKGLKRIPIIGTVISLAFAVDRFRRGDITGGVIDVVSGLAGLLDLALPGLGTTLSLGLDVFNAYLDFKAGGSSKEASAKKWDIIKEMSVKIYKKLEPLLRYMPIIGPVILLKEAKDSIDSGRYADAMFTLGQAFGALLPGIGPVFVALGDWMRTTQAPKMEETAFHIKNVFQDLQDKLAERFVEFFDASPTWLKWILKKHPVFSKVLEKQKEPDLAFAKQYGALGENQKVEFERDIRKQLVAEKQRIAQTRSDKDRVAAELQRQDAQKRIDKLEHQLAQITEAKKQPQQDFIWRAGQKPQAFSPKDNVIAIKDMKVFEELTKTLKERSNKGDDQNIILQIQREIHKLSQSMEQYLKQTQERDKQFQQNVLSLSAQRGAQSQASVDVDVRDPAYILRTRAWDHIRDGMTIY